MTIPHRVTPRTETSAPDARGTRHGLEAHVLLVAGVEVVRFGEDGRQRLEREAARMYAGQVARKRRERQGD